MCRLWHKHDETIMHIVSGCEILCGTKYLYRHEEFYAYLHWLILWDSGFRVCESWLHHVTLSTTTNGEVKIDWYTPLLTLKMVKFNIPNIMIWNATEQISQQIEVTVPQYSNVVSATSIKITKYKDLQI